MNDARPDPAQPYRGLIAGYTDAIRAQDFKANIAILFVAFMMGPILYNYPKFPTYLPIPFVLLPFLIVYFCLFMVLIPRYPKRGSKHFIVSRTAVAEDFIDDVRDRGRARAAEAPLRRPVRAPVVEDALHQHQLHACRSCASSSRSACCSMSGTCEPRARGAHGRPTKTPSSETCWPATATRSA